jgi:hypothetical protein
MTRTTPRAALLAAVLLVATRAPAQDRPSEEELFGAPAAPEEKPAPAGAQPSAGEGKPKPPAAEAGAHEGEPRPEEAEMFGSQGSPAAPPPPPERLVPRDAADPLQLGGQLYLRAQATWNTDRAPSSWPLTSPNLVDLYADVRPNDRVRGFVLGRMSYDPTIAPEASPQDASSLASALSFPTQDNPRVVLDQLWLNFDAGRRAFVTAGKQHVKWGVGRFWNPTDYLHPVKRDPLAVFDVRTGTSMLKVHVPWEQRGWNFYGVAFLEDLAGREATSRVGRVAAGGRAEIVLGTVELGLDGIVQDGRKPRFGLDVSAGIWDLDVYAEASLRHGIDGTWWRAGTPSPTTGDPFGYVRDDPEGFTPQLVLGGSWSRNYTDEDVVSVGAEYFYNDAGYDDPAVYPFLLAGAPIGAVIDDEPTIVFRDPAAFQPFYVVRHYAGAYVALPSPGSWNDTTLTLSVLGNLSDRSFVARLDHSVLALTYLRIETYVAGHFGNTGDEFRFGYALPLTREQAAAAGIPASVPLSRDAPILDVGIALRVSL